MAGRGQGGPCAACKQLHKKCHQDCIMKPHFPVEDARWANIHRIFGNERLKTMMRGVNNEERHGLVDSLAWEAARRIEDPVNGSHGMYTVVAAQNQASKNHNSLLMEANNLLKIDKDILQVRIQQLEAEVNDLRQSPAQ